MDKSLTNKIKALAIFGILIVFVAFVKWFFQGEFNSVESLQAFMKKFGVFGPLALVLFQAFQVVVPVFPGYLGCAVGAVMFGTWTGFWCRLRKRHIELVVKHEENCIGQNKANAGYNYQSYELIL